MTSLHSSRNSLISIKAKKSIVSSLIYNPYLTHSATINLSKKPFSKNFLLSLLEESKIKDFDELLERPNILTDEQKNKLLVLILKKDPDDRKQSEIQFLEKKMQTFDFFQKIKDKIPAENYMDLFKELRFETHQKNSLIFSFGDIGKKLFIILKGEVYVLVPKIKVQKEDDILIRKLDSLSNNINGKSENFVYEDEELGRSPKNNMKPSFFDDEDEFNEQKLLEKFPNFRIINTLKQGALFGEISVTLKEPRTATVICKQDSSFCILKSMAFERILKNNFDKELAFLQKVSLFRGMSLQNIAILKGYLQENIYPKDYQIFKPGDESNNIYIIKEGEVEMYKNLEIDGKRDNDNPLEHSLIEYAKEKLLNLKKTTSLIRKLSIGQTFGEEEIFLKNSRRSCYVIVSSGKARVLSLKKHNFFDNLKSLHILKNMEQDFNFKNKWQCNNIKHIITNRKLNEQTKISQIEKQEVIKNQMKTKEGKNSVLKSLTLKFVRTKENFKLNSNKQKSLYNSAHFRKNSKEVIESKLEDRILLTERTPRMMKKNGILNIEISPILKMSALTNTLSKLERRKKKFSMPNMKILLQNYEKNVQLENMMHAKKNPKNLNDENTNITKICKSLKLDESIRKKFIENCYHQNPYHLNHEVTSNELGPYPNELRKTSRKTSFFQPSTKHMGLRSRHLTPNYL